MDELPGQGRVRNVTAEMQAAARRLRAASTPAEKKLWAELSNRRLNGLRFRRQHAVAIFCFAFYCPEHRLVVEVEGGVHEDPVVAEHDRLREEHIARYGYRVVR